MAAESNLDLALRIKAQAEQARTTVAQVRRDVQDLGAASAQASATSAAASKTNATAAKEEAAAIGGVSAAQGARAESDTEAAARIHAMVQASAQAAEAERVRAAAATEGATATRAAAAADGAKARSTAEIVAAQNAAMVSYSQFTRLARDAGAAIEALKSGTLTAASFEKAVNNLGKAVDVGAISQEEYVAALKLADKAKIKDIALTEAQGAANKKAGLNARAQAEIATATSEVMSGNFGRLRRTGAAFANQAGLITRLMTPMGLSIGAVAVAVGAFVIAAMKGQKQSEAFGRALISTGTAAAATAGQLNDVVSRVGASTGRYGDANTALLTLAQTGKYTRTQLEQLAETSVEFATMTGGKVADGVKFVDGVMSGNIDTLMRLDKQYHFLSSTQFDHVLQLQEQGRQEEATAIAQKAASDAVHKRAQEVEQNAGLMTRAWNAVATAASGAWAAMKDVGATHSISQQLKDAMAELEHARGSHPNRAGAMVQNASPEAIAKLQAKVDDLRYQLAGQGIAQTAAAVDQNAEDKSKAAAARLAKFKTPAEVLLDAQKQAEKDLHDYLLGHHSDADIQAAYAHYHEELKRAKKQFDSANKNQLGDVARAQLDADVAAVQNQLKLIADTYSNGQKTLDAQHRAGLVNDQAYYDAKRGMLVVWERDRVAALEQEKGAAQSHIKTQADRIKADQKVAEIDRQITQTHSEAVAKRQQIDANEQQAIAKTQAAWEKFRASLGTPLEVHTDRVLAKLRELDQFFAKHATGGEAGYADALNRIFGGIDSGSSDGTAIGGNRFEAQRAKVEQHYQDVRSIQDAAYLAEMRNAQNDAQRKLAIQDAYNAASIQSERNRAAAIAAIQRQEAQFALSSAEQGFGALAQVYANAYGEQSRQARVAFALQKASALANAILAIQESVANSAKLGFPWNVVSIAGAIAQGAAVLATIRSTRLNVAGYEDGGYTGPGSRNQAAGIVHAGEVVWSQDDVARAGGVSIVEGMRLRGYAQGGVVQNPFAAAPSPAALGFRSQSATAVNAGKLMVAVSPVTVIVHGGSDDVKSQQSTDSDGGQVLELFLGAVAKNVQDGGVVAQAADRRWILQRKSNSYG